MVYGNVKMKFRKIESKLLILKSIIYRVLIIGIQIGFTYFFIRDIKMSIHISLWWNLINAILYYIYDYGFLSLFKIGEK